jgi:hypothetical protein
MWVRIRSEKPLSLSKKDRRSSRELHCTTRCYVDWVDWPTNPSSRMEKMSMPTAVTTELLYMQHHIRGILMLLVYYLLTGSRELPCVQLMTVGIWMSCGCAQPQHVYSMLPPGIGSSPFLPVCARPLHAQEVSARPEDTVFRCSV